MNNIVELSKQYEHYETPRWAADAILKQEKISNQFIDPCIGTGVLLKAAKDAGYLNGVGVDIHDWGSENLDIHLDFLLLEKVNLWAFLDIDSPFSVLMFYLDEPRRSAECVLRTETRLRSVTS